MKLALIILTINIIYISDLKARVISICDTFPEYCTNLKRNQSRPVNSSMPTQSSAVFTNPAAVSTDRGFGIESINYNDDAQIGIVTGTGRIGAAISNNPNEETFFGNGVQEDVNSYRNRWFKKEKYKSDKLVLSGAMNLYGKKKRRGIKIDAGISYRKINDVETSYVGGALAISFARILNFSYSEFRDAYVKDVRNKLVDYYNADGSSYKILASNDISNLHEKYFKVQNYVAGLNYKNWSFDYSFFSTLEIENNEKSFVKIFNISYFFRKWMLTYGTREEESLREEYNLDQKQMVQEKFKYNSFLGIQYAIGDHFVAGLFNNYYLLNEWTAGLTFFF